MSDLSKLWMWELQSLIPVPPAQLDKQTQTRWECEAGTGLETRCCEVHGEAENVAVKGWRDGF